MTSNQPPATTTRSALFPATKKRVSLLTSSFLVFFLPPPPPRGAAPHPRFERKGDLSVFPHSSLLRRSVPPSLRFPSNSSSSFSSSSFRFSLPHAMPGGGGWKRGSSLASAAAPSSLAPSVRPPPVVPGCVCVRRVCDDGFFHT